MGRKRDGEEGDKPTIRQQNQQQHNLINNENATNFNVTSFSCVAARTFAWKSTNMVGALAVVQAWIRIAFIVLVVAEFARETYGRNKREKKKSEKT